VITARFNPDLKEHYLELRRQFSVRLLPEFKALTSTYSQRLYRYLNSWKNSLDTTAELIFLHEILAVPPSFKKDFRQFRKFVLEPAHREILSQTGLVYAWEPVKRGQRKVVAIRFIFDIEKTALATKSESQKQEEAETVFELQRLSNQCFERLKRLKHQCEPKKSKKCDYCTTRGRMFAQRIVEEAQGRLLFEDLIAETASS
jgi:plasmid replication initiation protein